MTEKYTPLNQVALDRLHADWEDVSPPPVSFADDSPSANPAVRLAQRIEEAELKQWRAETTDRLTGLPNKVGIDWQIDEEIRTGKSFGAVYLDLDKFKLVNDEFGHEWGDEVLKRFARKLSFSIRHGKDARQPDALGRYDDGYQAARLHGDEWLVLVRNVDQTGLDTVADRLAKVEVGPEDFALLSPIGPVRATLGAAMYEPSLTRESFVALAETAMRGNKPARPTTE